VALVWSVELDGFVVLVVVLGPVGLYLAAAVLGGYHSAAWSVAWLVVRAGPVECLVGLAQDEFRSVGLWVDDIPVGPAGPVEWSAGDIRADRMVDDIQVDRSPAGDSQVDRRPAGDSLGFPDNARVGGKPAAARGRGGGSSVGDSASCRRIQGSRHSTEGEGDTRC
jgi:hypothetical protein